MNGDRLISDDAAHRWLLRKYTEYEANRVATLVWWGRYTLTDAVKELRGWVYLKADRAKLPDIDTNAFADALLDEFMAIHQADHQQSVQAMKEAALAAIRDGAGLAQARAVVARAAATRKRPVPVHLLTQALDEAAAEHRRTEAWWRKRGTAAE